MLQYRRFGTYLRETFGRKVFKVSVDAGLTCPVLDGTKAQGGCAYCNNASFKAKSVNRKQTLKTQIASGMKRQQEKLGAEKFLVYFQNFTNTYAPVEELRKLYETALSFPEVVGLSIGTRPDCLGEDVLALLASLAERALLWLELGLESSHDSTLEEIQRGHDYKCWLDAVWRASKYPKIQLATHVIFGLPGETEDMMLETIDQVSKTPIAGIKIHHLHVVKGTLLANRYLKQPFPTYSFDAYASLLSRSMKRLRKDIVLFRIFGHCPDKFLIAPHWPWLKNKTFGQLEKRLAFLGTIQGSECLQQSPVTAQNYFERHKSYFERHKSCLERHQANF